MLCRPSCPPFVRSTGLVSNAENWESRGSMLRLELSGRVKAAVGWLCQPRFLSVSSDAQVGARKLKFQQVFDFNVQRSTSNRSPSLNLGQVPTSPL